MHIPVTGAGGLDQGTEKGRQSGVAPLSNRKLRVSKPRVRRKERGEVDADGHVGVAMSVKSPRSRLPEQLVASARY